jgi:hypothetical protein
MQKAMALQSLLIYPMHNGPFISAQKVASATLSAKYRQIIYHNSVEIQVQLRQSAYIELQLKSRQMEATKPKL